MGPTTPSFWESLPLTLKFVFAMRVDGELRADNAHEVLTPMRQRFHDTDARVAAFARDFADLERELGGRDVVLARHRQRLDDRKASVVRLEGWLRTMAAAADAALGAKDPKGRMFATLTSGVHAGMFYRQAVRLANPVVLFLEGEGAGFVGAGVLPEEVPEGRALYEAAKADDVEEEDDLGEQVSGTGRVRELLARVVDFLLVWARRRDVLQSRLPQPLPGFNVGDLNQWIETRGSAIAARAEDESDDAPAGPARPGGLGALGVEPAPVDVVAEAVRAFRAGES